MKRTILLLAILFHLLAQAGEGTGCLSYEPVVVKLTGTVQLQLFPGHPNYVDLSKGDKPEQYAMLTLLAPICVLGDPKSELNRESETLTTVQLVPSAKVHNFKRYCDGQAHVFEGRLFHSHTAHHRTKVLLVVSKVTKVA